MLIVKYILIVPLAVSWVVFGAAFVTLSYVMDWIVENE
jgi:hypothetical protein